MPVLPSIFYLFILYKTPNLNNGEHELWVWWVFYDTARYCSYSLKLTIPPIEPLFRILISSSDWVRYFCPDQINYQDFSGFELATSRTWKLALFHIPCYPELTITLQNNAVWYISRIELIDRTGEHVKTVQREWNCTPPSVIVRSLSRTCDVPPDMTTQVGYDVLPPDGLRAPCSSYCILMKAC